MAGQLTTHVLDTAQGRPASDVMIQVWRIDASGARQTLVKTIHTMHNGRTEAPLLADQEMTAGTYELHFAVGAYFASQPVTTTTPPFLDIVPVRFSIVDPTAHYHVPLLVSPWSYSTYRGS